MYVPAADERKTQKAASLKVDTIVFDLEDGVAANQKVCQSLPLTWEDYCVCAVLIPYTVSHPRQ